jgi:hypothetical protein
LIEVLVLLNPLLPSLYFLLEAAMLLGQVRLRGSASLHINLLIL